MTTSSEVPAIVDNVQEQRFETIVDGHLSFLHYRRNATRLVLIHTEVPDELSGRGIGGALVEAAFESAAAAGLTVVPVCPFARTWLQRHPEAAERVTIDWPDD